MDGWFMDEKKNVHDYPQCYSGERSDLGGMYIRKGHILWLYLKTFVFEFYHFYFHNLDNFKLFIFKTLGNQTKHFPLNKPFFNLLRVFFFLSTKVDFCPSSYSEYITKSEAQFFSF